MKLIRDSGRYDRAAITARAQEIYRATGIKWNEARSQAYREASAQIRELASAEVAHV